MHPGWCFRWIPQGSRQLAAKPKAGRAQLAQQLGRHPLELLRSRLTALHVSLARELEIYRTTATYVSPDLLRTASVRKLMFISLEDESGLSNLLLRQDVQEHQRTAILSAQLMVVTGKLQNEQGVIHVPASDVRDYSDWLGRLNTESRNFR